MKEKDQAVISTDIKQVVLDFITALNNEDFEAARVHVNDDMTFKGVLGSRTGADAYFKDMEHMRLKYDIKKSFSDEEDVCLLYDITMSGVTIFSCGWYHIENDKIQSIRVVFDPRPILDGIKK